MIFDLTGYSVGWVVGQFQMGSAKEASCRHQVGRGWRLTSQFAPPLEVTESDLPIHRLSLYTHTPVEPSLSSKYTYDSFVVGSCNQFAHAASWRSLKLLDELTTLFIFTVVWDLAKLT